MAAFILIAWTAMLLIGWRIRRPLQGRVQAYADRIRVAQAIRQLNESPQEVDSLLKVIDQAAFQAYLSVINEALDRDRAGRRLTDGRVQELSRILQELSTKTQQLKGFASPTTATGERRAGEP